MQVKKIFEKKKFTEFYIYPPISRLTWICFYSDGLQISKTTKRIECRRFLRISYCLEENVKNYHVKSRKVCFSRVGQEIFQIPV